MTMAAIGTWAHRNRMARSAGVCALTFASSKPENTATEQARAKNARWAWSDRCFDQTTPRTMPTVRLAAAIIDQAISIQFESKLALIT